MTDASDITERGQAIDWVESTLESNAHYEHASPFLHDFVEKVVKGIQKPEDDANTCSKSSKSWTIRQSVPRRSRWGAIWHC